MFEAGKQRERQLGNEPTGSLCQGFSALVGDFFWRARCVHVCGKRTAWAM